MGQRELARQKRAQQMKSELIQANKHQIVLQDESRRQELQEEERIEEFAKKKAGRDRMINRQITQLRAIKDNEEKVLNKQVAEAEDKANRLFEEQERRKMEMKLAIERSR